MGVVFRQSVEGNTAQCVSLLSHIEESLWLLSSDDRLKETQLNVSLCCHILRNVCGCCLQTIG